MWTPLLAASLLLPTAQTYSGRLGPGFDDAVPIGQFSATRLGDVDGDGRLDALFWTGDGEFRIQRNAGFGRFEALPGSVPAASLGQDFTKFVVGELNGDGLLDLCLGREVGTGATGPGVTEVLLGDGAGGFTLTATFANDFPFNRAADDLDLVDLDSDGDLDVLQSSYGVLRVHRNFGAGQFDAAGAVLFAEPSERPIQATAFDFGGDGDLDFALVVGGAAGFVLEQLSPVSFSAADGLGNADREAFVADLDGDGLQDVVVAEIFSNFSASSEVRVYRQASGGLQLSQSIDASNNTLVYGVEQLDGDSEPDLVVARFNTGAAERLPGLAGAQFDAAAAVPFELEDAPARDLRFGDLDGDGDLDAVARSEEFLLEAPRLFFSNGAGQFRRLGVSGFLTLQDRRSVTDVDGDGTLDIVRIGSLNPPLGGSTVGELYRGDGLGGWTVEVRPDYVIDAFVRDYDLGDLDGDGDTDALIGALEIGGLFGIETLPENNRVLLNDGLGGLQEEPALEFDTADFSAFVLLFDAEGDGDLDAFLGNQDLNAIDVGDNRLALNDGSAAFSDASDRLPALRASSGGGIAEDFDGDGDLDLLVGDRSFGPFGEADSQPRLWLNDGAGTFLEATSQLPPVPMILAEALSADVDLDGDRDVFLAAGFESVLSSGNEWLLVNDGSATFNVGAAPDFDGELASAEFADVDLDGDPDLVRYIAGELIVAENSFGVFAAPEPFDGPGVPAGGKLAAGDFDNDGDVDLIVGRTLARSLITEVWPATPTSVGKGFQFELRAPGPGSGYLLAYSTGLISLELPGLGLLRLDPTAAFGVLGTGVLDAEGAAQATGTVPNSPGLVGVTVYVQALLGAPARLSRAFEATLTTL